ncbi:hypothetical protein PV10_06515 [Exophiala mesophila]|uniref:Uncharacterized protein n=1 Tax=Exophiala mesophila TaxID=212818 RepID=A0A0D1WSB4_EXOME|nr:uncharacterized protein PV10_06515 [Exophiala mesophila]KIV92040.1 hypothetical protein PV10_06515 [Exophiala mesophila]
MSTVTTTKPRTTNRLCPRDMETKRMVGGWNINTILHFTRRLTGLLPNSLTPLYLTYPVGGGPGGMQARNVVTPKTRRQYLTHKPLYLLSGQPLYWNPNPNQLYHICDPIAMDYLWWKCQQLS